MGLGIGLGAAATTALDTYTTLESNDRKNQELGLEKNQDKRAQAEADRKAAADAEEKASYKALAGGTAPVPFPGQGGAPVVNNNPSSPTNADTPVGTRPAAPSQSADGMVNAGTPDASAPSGGSSAKATGIPTGTKPGSQTQAMWQAFQQQPSKITYDAFVKARAEDRESAESAARIRESEVRVRAAEHALTQQDVEDSQKMAATASTRAAGTLEGYGSMSDDVAATDPRVVENTKRVLTELQKTHSVMADGQTADWTLTPQGVQVNFKDAKTGKPISSQLLGTVGDVRNAVHTTGMAVQPENYSKVIGLNTLTKISNEIRPATQRAAISKANNAATTAEMESSALDSTKKIAEAISDPTGAALLDPANADHLKVLATQAAIQHPEQVEYEKRAPRLDANGQPELDANGKVIMETTKGNRLLDVIEYNTPKQTATVKDSAGQPRTMTMDDASKVVVQKYPMIMKEANHDPNVASQIIQQSLAAQGFDQRTIAYYMPKIMAAGAAVQTQGLAAAAIPSNVAAKQPATAGAGRGVVLPRGSATPAPGRDLPTGLTGLLEKMKARGLRPE